MGTDARKDEEVSMPFFDASISNTFNKILQVSSNTCSWDAPSEAELTKLVKHQFQRIFNYSGKIEYRVQRLGSTGRIDLYFEYPPNSTSVSHLVNAFPHPFNNDTTNTTTITKKGHGTWVLIAELKKFNTYPFTRLSAWLQLFCYAISDTILNRLTDDKAWLYAMVIMGRSSLQMIGIQSKDLKKVAYHARSYTDCVDPVTINIISLNHWSSQSLKMKRSEFFWGGKEKDNHGILMLPPILNLLKNTFYKETLSDGDNGTQRKQEPKIM